MNSRITPRANAPKGGERKAAVASAKMRWDVDTEDNDDEWYFTGR